MCSIENSVRLGWHHFLFEVPGTWEVIGHKQSADDGQLIVSDRYGETMQVFWRRSKTTPAVEERLVEWAVANAGEAMTQNQIRDSVADWHGWAVVPAATTSSATFAARFLESPRVLLIVVFPPYPTADLRPLARQVLETFETNDGADRVWAAFGLDVTLPSEFELRHVQAFPAMQIMDFENQFADTISIHRYGMLPVLLGESDMATFIARRKGPRFQLRKRGTFQQSDQIEGLELGYHTRGREGLVRLLGRRREGRVWIWRRDDLQRLYCIDHVAPATRLRADLVQRVKCQ